MRLIILQVVHPHLCMVNEFATENKQAYIHYMRYMPNFISSLLSQAKKYSPSASPICPLRPYLVEVFHK